MGFGVWAFGIPGACVDGWMWGAVLCGAPVIYDAVFRGIAGHRVGFSDTGLNELFPSYDREYSAQFQGSTAILMASVDCRRWGLSSCMMY